MFQLILSSIAFVPWVIYIILTYYSTAFSRIDHMESATGYGGYLAAIGITYLIYKTISMMSNHRHVRFSFWHLTGFSLIHLFIVTVAYTALQKTTGSPFFGAGGASSIVLFGHIISLLVYPILLALLWRATGYSILNMIPGWRDIILRIRIGAEISIGIALFATGLLIFGIFHMFTLTWLLIVCGILTIVAIPWWIATYRDIRTRYVEFDQHDTQSESIVWLINPKLITAEFAFLIMSFLIAVSLINAIRPMPIGWDDLGVYMNFPRIMAITGSALEWAGTYTWQLITGSWFLWNQIAASAFYINQLGGILSMIVMTSILSVVFEVKNRKYLIALPILLSGIYYIMPMTIFQQAKDMKLDPALMMVSVSAFWVLWYALREKLEKNKFYILIGIAGFIVGLAFSIKFTTLMLIVAGLALISYRTLGIFGLGGFFFIFLSIFTGGNLWTKMNVWMPTENIELIRSIAIWLGIIGIVSLVAAYMQNGMKEIRIWIIASLVFILGIALALTPWFLKNGIEAHVFTSQQKWGTIDNLLGGYGGSLELNNYGAIYSAEEYKIKSKALQDARITSDGKSLNEDFSRYFGQESWLNNYLKLPANLTFQKNQGWEFTDITYIFLAFIPAILLFVRWRVYRKSWWTALIFPILVGLSILVSILYYFVGSTGALFTNMMSTIVLPVGYAFIISGILVSMSIAHFFIETDEIGSRTQDIIMMLLVYGFLFLISAFGIVWYGVFVYFLFLALIGLASLTFTTYQSDESDDRMGIKITISFLFFLFILVYIIRSAFPHGWNNLLGAGMNEYKYKKLNQNESIFTYRADYITPIATINTINPQAVVVRAGWMAKSVAMQKILTPERLANMKPADLHQVLLYFITQIASNKPLQDKAAIENDIEKIGAELYSSILSPKWTEVNTKGIYRIGTFMTYLINDNRKRYLDDSLVFDFETFFYDSKPENTIERMKKVGLGYLLTDLNAATIDRDPRHVLTTRFEHLLLTMRANNLKLIDTDNLCLKVAINEYKLGKLQSDNEFIDIAGTNYESYRTSGPIYRGVKQSNCANYIIKMLNAWSASGGTIPPYLTWLNTGLTAAKNETEQQNVLSQYIGQSYFALFEIQ